MRNLPTLDVLAEYRAGVETSEALPFGIWGHVEEPGSVRLGDPVDPCSRGRPGPIRAAVHPELESEQAYVDHAYACLEEMRRQVERAGEAGIGEIEALVLEAWANKRLVTFEDAERGLCFGRLDLDGVVRPLYVGRRWVHEEQTPIVVNWQAPAARAFYTATVAEPQGVALRRRFRTEGRRLLDLYDEPLDGSAGDIVHGVADILLEELERSRDEHMRDIVATIQTDQYRLITREPDGVLVIQGGPGHRQDRGRPPPGVVAPLHVPPRAGAERRPRRRAESGVHGLHLARPPDARRGARRAAGGRRARRRRRRRPGARSRRSPG